MHQKTLKTYIGSSGSRKRAKSIHGAPMIANVLQNIETLVRCAARGSPDCNGKKTYNGFGGQLSSRLESPANSYKYIYIYIYYFFCIHASILIITIFIVWRHSLVSYFPAQHNVGGLLFCWPWPCLSSLLDFLFSDQTK